MPNGHLFHQKFKSSWILVVLLICSEDTHKEIERQLNIFIIFWQVIMIKTCLKLLWELMLIEYIIILILVKRRWPRFLTCSVCLPAFSVHLVDANHYRIVLPYNQKYVVCEWQWQSEYIEIRLQYIIQIYINVLSLFCSTSD